jgi:L-iditol 2-dehydrogenase
LRQAVLTGPGDVRIAEVPWPEPGPGEVVVRIDAALTGGTVLKMVRRGYHAALGEPPLALGHEGAGTIAAVGEGVEAFAVGDRVVPANSAPCQACPACARGLTAQCTHMTWLTGTFAEAVRVPARIVATNLHRIPEGCDAAVAALADNVACVLKGRDRTPARRGERVVVIGAGAMGLLWTRVLSLVGVHVVAVDRFPGRLETARTLGAAETLDATDFAALAADWQVGADLVVEAVGSPECWALAVEAAAPGGRIQLFGGPPRGSTLTLDTNRVHYRELLLAASFHHTPAHFAEAVRLLGTGLLDAHLLLEERVALDDLPGFLGRHFEGGGPLKAVVTP